MSANADSTWYHNLIYDESNIADTNWHHLAMTFDTLGAGATGKLFVGGVKVNEHTGDATPYNPYDLAFGAGLGGSGVGSYFDGQLDDVMIFNKALNATQRRALYKSQRGGKL